MILFPEKEYSQRMLDELNSICYGFLESATEYLIGETDEEYLKQELKLFFPSYLVDQDLNCCLDTLETLYAWIKDGDHYYPITHLHEYVLTRAIHTEWTLFNDLPDNDSQKLREVFYRLSEEAQLSETEEIQVSSMKNSERATMAAFFKNADYGELELFAALYQKPLSIFLRF